MTVRLWRVSAVLFVTATVLAGSVGPASAGALSYSQFNIYGNLGHQGDLDSAFWAKNRIANMISSGAAPFAATFQEVCEGTVATASQLHMLFNYLTTQGYYQVNYTARYLPYDECHGFGNVVYGWGQSIPDPNDQFAEPFANQHPGTSEFRGIACGVFPAFGSQHTACSTHLFNNDDVLAGKQYDEAVAVQNNTRVVHPGFAHYLGADLNLCYRQVKLRSGTLYNNHYELNGAPGVPSDCYSTIGGMPYFTVDASASWTQKVDYGFLHMTGFNGMVLPPSRINPNTSAPPQHPISDHAFFAGVFTSP